MIPTFLRIAAVAACLALGACTTTVKPQEIEAVRDFVAANELTEVDQIRLTQQMSYTYVNDRYVIIPTRRGDFLAEFRRDCRELRRSRFTEDMIDRRDNQNIIRARFDTIRGCVIGRIYEISEGQRAELHDLGDAPGDEIFLPDEKEK